MKTILSLIMIDLLELSHINSRGSSLELTGYMDLHVLDYSAYDEMLAQLIKQYADMQIR